MSILHLAVWAFVFYVAAILTAGIIWVIVDSIIRWAI